MLRNPIPSFGPFGRVCKTRRTETNSSLQHALTQVVIIPRSWPNQAIRVLHVMQAKLPSLTALTFANVHSTAPPCSDKAAGSSNINVQN